jgi:hypothetical protein
VQSNCRQSGRHGSAAILRRASLNHAQDLNISRQPARLLSKVNGPADMAELPLVARCIDCTNEQIRYHGAHA